MEYKHILVDISEAVCTVTINRAEKLNSLNEEVLHELGAVMNAVDENKEVRVVILTGAGTKAFVAGADIKKMSEMSNEEAIQFSRLGQGVLDKIERLKKPVIGAINGYALGGGCELAMACDFRIASNKAKFGQPEVKLGIITGFGGSVRLTRITGPGHAKELMFTGRMISADEGERIGLVNRVVDSENLMEESKKVAVEIAKNGTFAVEFSKRLVNHVMDLTSAEGMTNEAESFGECFSKDEQTEGMLAFLEKRDPDFNGK